jgi:hypothetical protein
MDRLPYLLPWFRVLLLIRSITSMTWGHEAWPLVKPVLRRALEMKKQIARDGWWNQSLPVVASPPRSWPCTSVHNLGSG